MSSKGFLKSVIWAKMYRRELKIRAMKPSCWKEIFVTGVNKKKVKASEAVVARKRRKNKIRK